MSDGDSGGEARGDGAPEPGGDALGKVATPGLPFGPTDGGARVEAPAGAGAPEFVTPFGEDTNTGDVRSGTATAFERPRLDESKPIGFDVGDGAGDVVTTSGGLAVAEIEGGVE